MWLTLSGLFIAALVWLSRAAPVRLKEPPTIAQEIAKSKLSRGQLATLSGVVGTDKMSP